MVSSENKHNAISFGTGTGIQKNRVRSFELRGTFALYQVSKTMTRGGIERSRYRGGRDVIL